MMRIAEQMAGRRLTGVRRGLSIAAAAALIGLLATTASAGRAPGDDSVLPRAADQLSWTVEQTIIGHRNMHRLFPVTMIRAGTRPFPLPQGRPIAPVYSYDGARHDTDDYMKRTNSVGLLVIKDGRIVLEKYTAGNTPQTMWASRSVAKSITSIAMGMAIREGRVSGVDALTSTYVPELASTAYGQVRIRNLLQMSSGVVYREGEGDAADLQACTVRRQPGCFLAELIKWGSRPGAREQGSVFNYASADALLDGLIVSRATGRSLPAYIEEKLWRPFGMEHDAYWITESPGGIAMAPSGFGATLRDWGRIGLFMLRGGRLPDGTAILPANWVGDSATPSPATAGTPRAYGYHWWLHPVIDPALGAPSPAAIRGGDTMYMAMGSRGQMIAVNPAEQVVIVKWAAHANPPARPSGADVANEDRTFMAAVIDSLR